MRVDAGKEKKSERKKFAKEPGGSAGDAGCGCAGEPRDCAQNRKWFGMGANQV
jgi:hypothetical protein